ncbi:MAG TPA: hypothetical protein VFQ61_13705 [Polyangiaceae bacterium]|nr:hypothetical protein [Polyangiaceae bacterium]
MQLPLNGGTLPVVIAALIATRTCGPRRRFRGKKRYFRRVLRDAASFQLEHADGGWWNLWHYHADWFGWGNKRWRYRREHLRALALVFLRICKDAAEFTGPFQTWIYLSGRDAGEDATYLHTPNSNHSPFPMVPHGDVDWDCEPLLPLFRDLLPELPLRIGMCRVFDGYAEPPRVTTSFFIYSPGVGVPLEQPADSLKAKTLDVLGGRH